MIYKDSEADKFQCRQAFHYNKRYGDLMPNFIFPPCAGSKCAHWEPQEYYQYWYPKYTNWKTGEGEYSKEFQWRSHISNHSIAYCYSYEDVPRPDPVAEWSGVDVLGCWRRKAPDSLGQCGLNFSTLEVQS